MKITSAQKKGTDYSVPNAKWSIAARGPAVDRAVCPLFLVSLLVCSACSIGPKYVAPTLPTPAPVAFREMKDNPDWKMAVPSDTVMKGNWWEIFGDPQLNKLEEMININNQNVKQAEAQFRQARAIVAANHANYYPTIGSTPAITQSDTGRVSGRGLGGTSQSFSLPFTASWEPDFWGRVRLSVQNAVDSAQASAATLENARLSAQALLATDYFLIAGNDMQQDVLKRTIEDYQKNLTLTLNRFNGRRGLTERCVAGADAATRCTSPEHRSPNRAGTGRACDCRSDRAGAFNGGDPRAQNETAAAHTHGDSFRHSAAPP